MNVGNKHIIDNKEYHYDTITQYLYPNEFSEQDYNILINAFENEEEYKKCAVLLKIKNEIYKSNI